MEEKETFRNIPDEIFPLWRDYLNATLICGAVSSQALEAKARCVLSCKEDRELLQIFEAVSDSYTVKNETPPNVSQPTALTSNATGDRDKTNKAQRDVVSIQNDIIAVLKQSIGGSLTPSVQTDLAELVKAFTTISISMQTDPSSLVSALIESGERAGEAADRLGEDLSKVILLAVAASNPKLRVMFPFRNTFGILDGIQIEVELLLQVIARTQFRLIPASRDTPSYPHVTITDKREIVELPQGSNRIISQPNHGAAANTL